MCYLSWLRKLKKCYLSWLRKRKMCYLKWLRKLKKHYLSYNKLGLSWTNKKKIEKNVGKNQLYSIKGVWGTPLRINIAKINNLIFEAFPN